MKEIFEKVIKIESSMPITLDDLNITFGNGDEIPNLKVTEVISLPKQEDKEPRAVVRENRMTELMTQEEFTDKHARANDGRIIKNAAMMYQGYIIGFTKKKSESERTSYET